jgi:hypothetical protein
MVEASAILLDPDSAGALLMSFGNHVGVVATIDPHIYTTLVILSRLQLRNHFQYFAERLYFILFYFILLSVLTIQPPPRSVTWRSTPSASPASNCLPPPHRILDGLPYPKL